MALAIRVPPRRARVGCKSMSTVVQRASRLEREKSASSSSRSNLIPAPGWCWGQVAISKCKQADTPRKAIVVIAILSRCQERLQDGTLFKPIEYPDGHAVLRQAVNNMMHVSTAPSCSSFRILILREKRTDESGQLIMHDKDYSVHPHCIRY